MGIHTGEDWNGVGCGNTDLGQPVYSIGKGVVVQADNYYSPWGNIVLIKHKFLENGNFRIVLSLFAHLDTIYISKGDTVNRRDSIGTIGTGGSSYPAHLHFEIRKDSLADYPADYWPSSAGKDINWVFENYEDPSKFLNSHRVLTSPGKEDKIIIAIKHEYRMYLYFDSVLQKKYEIALSQNPYGHKEKQGDNRLPEGEYLIIEKAFGPFSGEWSEYFGPAWIRINYPNNFDALEGFKKKLISEKEMNQIIKANNQGEWPSKTTKLGGGIGIHGWSGEWDLSGYRNLTWGCISMQNNDIKEFHSLIDNGTKIIILP